MSEQMYLDDYLNISNIDISNIVIEQMNSAYSNKYPKMKCMYSSFIIINTM